MWKDRNISKTILSCFHVFEGYVFYWGNPIHIFMLREYCAWKKSQTVWLFIQVVVEPASASEANFRICQRVGHSHQARCGYRCQEIWLSLRIASMIYPQNYDWAWNKNPYVIFTILICLPCSLHISSVSVKNLPFSWEIHISLKIAHTSVVHFVWKSLLKTKSTWSKISF